MGSDWMSKADRFNGRISDEKGIGAAAEVRQQRLTGDIHFKTREAFSAKKQKASGLYEKKKKKTTLAWSATPMCFPGVSLVAHGLCSLRALANRSKSPHHDTGFPPCPPGAPKGHK